MNREIKFRAWDKKEKLMRYEHKYDCWILAVEFNGNLIEFEPYGGAIETLDWAIMQYTGLKDKNGKEIYEGDIVYADDYVGFNKIAAEVIFNRGRFCLNTGTIPEDLFPELCEIIGNIYENPTLIKILENGN